VNRYSIVAFVERRSLPPSLEQRSAGVRVLESVGLGNGSEAIGQHHLLMSFLKGKNITQEIIPHPEKTQ